MTDGRTSDGMTSDGRVEERTRDRLRAFLEREFDMSGIRDDTDFTFDYGMGSMALVVMLTSVEQEFGVTLPDRGVFRYAATFSTLADELERALAARSDDA